MEFIFPQQEEVVRKMRHILGVFTESDCKIRPHFHLTGPSGSGKSYLVKQCCDEIGIKFIEVGAAQLTAEGLSGNSLSKALRKLREHWNEPNVIFVDEFDKLFQRNGETTENFRSAVQDEFLTNLESKYASILTDYGKYEPVVVENSLFIFAGAYSNQKITNLTQLKDAGLRTEFLGRVPLVLAAEEVPISELQKHIVKMDLYQHYKKLNPSIKDKATVDAIIKQLVIQNKETPIGIRLVNTAIHLHFMAGI